jgi:hypothetical protein
VSDWFAQYVNGVQTRILRRPEAAQMASCSDVTGTLDTELRFTDRDPAAIYSRREFRIVPITDDQAADWRARHPPFRQET